MHKPGSRPQPSDDLLGLLAIALAAALWALAAAVAKDLFERGVQPLELVQARAYLTTAGLALIPAAWRRAPEGASWWGPALLGVAIALVNAAYYLAIDHLAVAVAIVLQYLAPAIVVAWTAMVARRKPPLRVLTSLSGAFLGVVLVSEVLGGSLGTVSAFGLAMGLCAALMFAAYTLLSESVGATYGILPALFRAFTLASAGWILYQAPRGLPDALWSDGALLPTLFVGLGGTLGPFLLFLWGVQRVRAERAAIAATLEPVLAGVVAWVLLGETLSAVQMAGGGLVIASVAALQLRATREPELDLAPDHA